MSSARRVERLALLDGSRPGPSLFNLEIVERVEVALLESETFEHLMLPKHDLASVVHHEYPLRSQHDSDLRQIEVTSNQSNIEMRQSTLNSSPEPDLNLDEGCVGQFGGVNAAPGGEVGRNDRHG